MPRFIAEHLDELPANLRGGVQRYIEDGIEPGQFLCAVIDHDLFEAVTRFTGPPEQLKQIVMWFNMHAPSPCHGSKRKREKWADERRAERMVEDARRERSE